MTSINYHTEVRPRIYDRHHKAFFRVIDSRSEIRTALCRFMPARRGSAMSSRPKLVHFYFVVTEYALGKL